jgi:hypothetical protein
MAVIEGVRDIVLLGAAGFLLLAVACFLYVWWAIYREDYRSHSYEPLEPEDED